MAGRFRRRRYGKITLNTVDIADMGENATFSGPSDKLTTHISRIADAADARAFSFILGQLSSAHSCRQLSRIAHAAKQYLMSAPPRRAATPSQPTTVSLQRADFATP